MGLKNAYLSSLNYGLNKNQRLHNIKDIRIYFIDFDKFRLDGKLLIRFVL